MPAPEKKQPKSRINYESEWRNVDTLRSHPEHARFFGDPEKEEHFPRLLKDIKTHGIVQALIIKPDGTILDGHCRAKCAELLGLPRVPVRLVPEPFADYRDEVAYMVHFTLMRSHMSAGERELAERALRKIERDDAKKLKDAKKAAQATLFEPKS